MTSNLYSTTVVHERLQNFKHKFKYFVLSMYIDHNEVVSLSQNLKIFSYNSFNIFSFFEKDHGYRDGRTLKEFVEDYLVLNKILYDQLNIKIMCFPRILGYVFNPLSIIYCYDNSKLIAIFYEVKNTSNEQHTYCFAGNEKVNANEHIHKCNKNFYVSPFIGMKVIYKFRNLEPDKKMSIVIDLYDEDRNKILIASQYGEKIPLNSFTLLKQLFINPLVTLKIFLAIMYEAFSIFLKGGKYYSRKKKLSDSISFEGKL